MTESTLMTVNQLLGRSLAAILAVVVLCAAPDGARAAPKCLGKDNPCSPDKLCTFKAQLAEKVFLYQAYLRNSQVTRRLGRRDGVRYDGALYEASVSEARASFPNASAADLKVKAGQIFQEKLRKHADEKFKITVCSNGGKLQSNLLPKAGYAGMFTDEHCRIRVNYEGGDYDPEGFGATHTSCQEFYDRDVAHEVIHQRSCQAAQKKGKDLHDIDVMIEDEVAAYRHSVQLSQAYLRLMSLQCSARQNEAALKLRAKRVLDRFVEKA